MQICIVSLSLSLSFFFLPPALVSNVSHKNLPKIFSLRIIYFVLKYVDETREKPRAPPDTRRGGELNLYLLTVKSWSYIVNAAVNTSTQSLLTHTTVSPMKMQSSSINDAMEAKAARGPVSQYCGVHDSF